jgi:hypothetical protein
MLNTHEDGQARALLRTAADSIPGSGDALAGDLLARDLLASVRARHVRSRRRIRVTLSLSTATALAGGAIAAVVATTASSVQSAYAAVTAAARTTSSQSFRMTTGIELPRSLPIRRPLTGGPETGEFDLARRVGELTQASTRTLLLFADGWEYRRVPPAKDSHGKPWVAFRTPSTLPMFALIGPLSVGAADEATPQSLFGLLKAARGVRLAGPASGPGWTGTRYTFTFPGGQGTVAIDRQGRVRELDFPIMVFQSAAKPSAPDTGTISMTFGDFGVPVTVTAPPASEVYFEPGS